MDAIHHHEYYYYNNKKSGQIPAFGNWDYTNELPITQYFESARQAGLIRYNSSSSDNLPYLPRGDLYTVDHHHHHHHQHKPSLTFYNPNPTARKTTKRSSQVNNNDQKKQVQQHGGKKYNNNNNRNHYNKVYDVAEQPRKLVRNDAVSRPQAVLVHRLPKPVDEDLYKIPPELLHATKRKKRLGIFSRCLVPACSS